MNESDKEVYLNPDEAIRILGAGFLAYYKINHKALQQLKLNN